MLNSDNRRLDAREAAKIIYNTMEPTSGQIERVREKLARGSLKGNATAGWTTTSDVCEYLATRTVQRQSARQEDQAAGPELAAALAVQSNLRARPSQTRPGNSELPDVYRDLIKDYLLAVIRRQNTRRRSKLFQRAVLAGQVICLLCLLGGLLLGFRLVRALEPPERVAVGNWLEKNIGDYVIVQWHPTLPAAKGDGALVRVEYKYYSSSRKPITTHRAFLVQQEQVTPMHDLELGSQATSDD